MWKLLYHSYSQPAGRPFRSMVGLDAVFTTHPDMDRPPPRGRGRPARIDGRHRSDGHRGAKSPAGAVAGKLHSRQMVRAALVVLFGPSATQISLLTSNLDY